MRRLLAIIALLPALAIAGTPLALKYDSQTGATTDIPSSLTKINFPAGFQLQVAGVPIGSSSFSAITGQPTDNANLSAALAAKAALTGANVFTNNNTLSDPTKTFLFGASSMPNVSGTNEVNGGQLVISTRASDTKEPFVVYGDYRTGSSGDRYTTSISKTGTIFSNASILLSGVSAQTGQPSPAYITDNSMMLIVPDVHVGLSLASLGPDSDGDKLISGWGIANTQNNYQRVFDVSTQGTVTIQNPYGTIGGVNYSRPQIVLGDVGTNSASPSWTYGSLRQSQGHTYLGSYVLSGNTQNDEIDVTTNKVSVHGAFQQASTGASVTPPSLGQPWDGYFYNGASFARVGIDSSANNSALELLESSARKWVVQSSGGTFTLYDVGGGFGSVLDLTPTTGAAYFHGPLRVDGTLTLPVGSVTDGMLASSVKPAVAVVAATNLTLSGEQTLDGITTSSSPVLCTAQSTASQNGPWISGSGSWTRPTWYANGSATQAPQFLTTFVRLGTVYSGSTWRMTTANVTIGTTATTWVQTPLAMSATSITGNLPASAFGNVAVADGLSITLTSVATFGINSISGSKISGGTLGATAGTNLTGTAPSLTAGNATKWTTGRTIALTGDVTYTSGSLDGSGNVTGASTLANIPAISGVNLTNLNATNLGSGTVPTARLGSGTANSTTVLYGDQSYKSISSSLTIGSTTIASGSGSNKVLYDNSGTLAESGSPTLDSLTISGGGLIVSVAGNSLTIKGGSNAKIGSGTLVGGTATISNTSVTTNSKIFLQDTSTSITNVGVLTVSSKTAGTGFVVTSTLALDTSTFDYWIVEAN